MWVTDPNAETASYAKRLSYQGGAMSPDATGGYGPEEIRAYWTEQWAEINPHVEPVDFHEQDTGLILVDVHQVVRSLAGDVLADEHVGHQFTINEGLIQGMEVCPLPSPAPDA
ncbi:MAG: nuclear transport factor 2 family protein [Pseudomonadota bacterium]